MNTRHSNNWKGTQTFQKRGIFNDGITVNGPIEGGGMLGHGKTFYVNPKDGNNGNTGRSPSKAVATLDNAYGKCTSGAGDNIIVYSAGTTTANTTTYLTAAMTWSKHGITVVGVQASPIYGRARVANASTALTLASMINVSGNNNSFHNLHVGNYGSDAAALGCLNVTGDRNYFANCHFIGGGHATPAADAGMYSVKLDGAEENVFDNCYLGTDTIDRAAANGELLVDGACYRNEFHGCRFISMSSATAGKGAVKFADASAIGRNMVFTDCLFDNFKSGAKSANTSVFIGTAPTSGVVIVFFCGALGYSAWGAANDAYQIIGGATSENDAGLAIGMA